MFSYPPGGAGEDRDETKNKAMGEKRVNRRETKEPS